MENYHVEYSDADYISESKQCRGFFLVRNLHTDKTWELCIEYPCDYNMDPLYVSSYMEAVLDLEPCTPQDLEEKVHAKLPSITVRYVRYNEL